MKDMGGDGLDLKRAYDNGDIIFAAAQKAGNTFDERAEERGALAVTNPIEIRKEEEYMADRHACENCKTIFRIKELKKCSKCKVARYCSRECQVENWKEHRRMCAMLLAMSEERQ